MGECICSSCVNLKSVIDDDGEMGEYQCAYGFPSDNCEDCDELRCDAECVHYECDEQNDLPETVSCKGCGKKLEKVFNEDTEGDIFCVECYMKNI